MSLRKAINDKCKECIYDQGSGGGTWRQQVAACTSPQCPLYPVRPMPETGAKRANTQDSSDVIQSVGAR